MIGDKYDKIARAIIRMHGDPYLGDWNEAVEDIAGSIREAAEEARAEEREACAAIADGESRTPGQDPFCCTPLAKDIAARIRARSQP